MVGQQILDLPIGVRIPGGQPIQIRAWLAKSRLPFVSWNNSNPETSFRFQSVPRFGQRNLLPGVILALLAMLAISAALLVRWPFREAVIIKDLEEDGSGKVEIKTFREIYSPYPGCVPEGCHILKPFLLHSGRTCTNAQGLRFDQRKT
jgi:hypothetical protein